MHGECFLYRIPKKYKHKVKAFWKSPKFYGGAKYELWLNESYEHYEGSQLYFGDTLDEILWVVRNSEKIGENEDD